MCHVESFYATQHSYAERVQYVCQSQADNVSKLMKVYTIMWFSTFHHWVSHGLVSA